MAFLSECSSMQAMPSPRSTSEAPGLERTTPWERRKSATRAWPGMAGMGSDWPVAGWKQASLPGEYQLVREAASRACDRER